jgi:predicted nucleic-acid-binding protein
MISIDTDVLVHLLTNDDPVQARRAAEIMESADIYIPKTVMLETEWVLRYTYEIDKARIMKGFQKLLGLWNAKFEDLPSVALAISWYGYGIDFADALHLASSREAEEFATFDNSFANKAKRISAGNIIIL